MWSSLSPEPSDAPQQVLLLRVHHVLSVGREYQQSLQCARDQLPRFQSGIPGLQNDVDESTSLAMRRLRLRACSENSPFLTPCLPFSMPENDRSIQLPAPFLPSTLK